MRTLPSCGLNFCPHLCAFYCDYCKGHADSARRKREVKENQGHENQTILFWWWGKYIFFVTLTTGKKKKMKWISSMQILLQEDWMSCSCLVTSLKPLSVQLVPKQNIACMDIFQNRRRAVNIHWMSILPPSVSKPTETVTLPLWERILYYSPAGIAYKWIIFTAASWIAHFFFPPIRNLANLRLKEHPKQGTHFIQSPM